MKFIYTQLNTLSVPTPGAQLRNTCVLLLLCAMSNMAAAGIQHYQAPLDSVTWKASSKKLHCTLTHEIPLYGTATFAQNAGDKLGFTLSAKREATRGKDSAHLRALPPQWKHQVSVVDLGKVAVHKGGTPFQLKADLSRRMLAELQKGMFPTFSYRDWADARDQVTVTLPGINIKPMLDEFITCLANLPVYKFSDFKINLLHFAFGKYELSTKARKRLDDVARYLKSDPSVKKIEISGHTDNIGRRRSNDALGKRRSKAVKDYLVAKGVPVKLFKLITHGERKPKASNRTDKGRAENRRASVTLVR
jgi:outer membrane protein OmpA-like peptidoglycan-associated protein